jgi:hypothetical protein
MISVVGRNHHCMSKTSYATAERRPRWWKFETLKSSSAGLQFEHPCLGVNPGVRNATTGPLLGIREAIGLGFGPNIETRAARSEGIGTEICCALISLRCMPSGAERH